MSIANLQFVYTPMLVALLYLALGGAYLVVLPFCVFMYLKARWNFAGSVERVFMFFFVFFSFPGMIVLSPFLNFRPQKRQIAA